MAKITQVTLIDDLDGGAADQTIVFSLDGDSFEIDVSSANADEFRSLLAPYVEKARKVDVRRGNGHVAKARSKVGSGVQNPAAIRAWALETGRTVSSRGRIPASIVADYEAAHV